MRCSLGSTEVREAAAEARRVAREDPLALVTVEMSPSRRQAVEQRMAQVPVQRRGTYARAVNGSVAAAVRAFCLECVGWQRADVTGCTALACPLYSIRPFSRDISAEIDEKGEGGGFPTPAG